MRLIFFGSPDYAVPSLRAVHAAGHEVAAVVTQPPRKAGRGRGSRATPVAVAAQEIGLRLPVLTPQSATNDPAFAAALSELRPQIILVVAYGQILRQQVLDVPPLGCVNAHASLLPKWRGAAPAAAAIRAGERQSGVTLIKLIRRLDAGPILRRRTVDIAPRETAGSLLDKLAQVSAECFVEYLGRLDAGECFEPRPQDDALATCALKLTKEDGRIDWSQPAEAIDQHVRAMHPWPGAFTTLPAGGRLKIPAAEPAGEAAHFETDTPGTVRVAAARDGLLIACGRGRLRLLNVQPEGKQAMSAGAFLAGHRLEVGSRLG